MGPYIGTLMNNYHWSREYIGLSLSWEMVFYWNDVIRASFDKDFVLTRKGAKTTQDKADEINAKFEQDKISGRWVGKKRYKDG